MREITKLTRAQKLMEATRLIQSTLRRRELPPKQDNPEQPQIHDKPTRFKRPLGEVVNILRRAKQGLEIPLPRCKKTIIVPNGAQFLSGSFECLVGKAIIGFISRVTVDKANGR